MCGIAAIFGKSSSEAYKHIFAMIDIIHYRGPDDEGVVLFNAESPLIQVLGGKATPPSVYDSPLCYTPIQRASQIPCDSSLAALAHRRLSIVDLSPAGHQPLCSTDQRYWITFNGEVYNYIEIRNELVQLGHTFHSSSDTEVLIHAYQQWGAACLHKFNGMFAFILYDCQQHKFVAARDRFGVKPLYYWKAPNGLLAFASEIKQFTVLPGWKATLNGQTAYDFLNWGVLDHSSETLFQGVQQLRGGEYIECSVEALHSPAAQPKQWYDLQPQTFNGSFQEAAAQFADLLHDAVRLRLRADVDVGSCLSGGLDSSSIVCLANKMMQGSSPSGRQKIFSACSHEKRFDERNFIDLVVKQTQVDAFYTYPSLDNLFEECQDIVWHQDEPFGSTSIYAQWMVFKLVKQQGVKVMLDGQGADEQLGGYHGFFHNRMYDLLCSFRWKTLLQERRSIKDLHGSAPSLLNLMNKCLPEALRQPLRRLLGRSAAHPGWLDTARLNISHGNTFLHEKQHSVKQQSRLQILRSSLPMLLHFEDRDSMAHSVESRTPFLDYRLVEFVLGLPGDFKVANGWTKRVLREGMRGILPEEIRMRVDKLGFATAEEVWMKQHHKQRFREAAAQAIERSQGVIMPHAMHLVDAMLEGKQPFSFFIWRLISFGMWMNRFSVQVIGK